MEFYTVKQAAAVAKVNPKTIWRWLGEGRLKGRKIGPGATAGWRISAEELRKALDPTPQEATP